MKQRHFLAAILLSLYAQFCFAQDSVPFHKSEEYKEFERGMSLQLPQRPSFYSAQGLEHAKPVQLVGAQRSIENLERESHVGKIVELNQNRLRFCYERILGKSPVSVESIFYFAVTKDGVFDNLTADFAAKGSNENIQSLLDCVSSQLKSMRAAKGGTDLTFRFRVKFGLSE